MIVNVLIFKNSYVIFISIFKTSFFSKSNLHFVSMNSLIFFIIVFISSLFKNVITFFFQYSHNNNS